MLLTFEDLQRIPISVKRLLKYTFFQLWVYIVMSLALLYILVKTIYRKILNRDANQIIHLSSIKMLKRLQKCKIMPVVPYFFFFKETYCSRKYSFFHWNEVFLNIWVLISNKVNINSINHIKTSSLESLIDHNFFFPVERLLEKSAVRICH